MLTRKRVMTNNGTSMPWNSLFQSSGEGYWVSQTGVRNSFDSSEDYIVNGVLQQPPWRADALIVMVPEGITVIAEDAFKGCTDLFRINLPTTFNEIKGGAFDGCTNLRDFFVKAVNVPTFAIPTTPIGGADLQVKVPAESYDDYRTAPTWSIAANRIFVLNRLYPGSRVHSGYVNTTERIVRDQVTNVVIDGLLFDGDVLGEVIPIVFYRSSNIIIRNCRFINFPKNRTIHIEGSQNVVVYNCDFEGVQCGIRLADCTGNVRAFSNDFKNILGNLYGAPYGQAAQFMGCTGNNFRFQDNMIENIPGESSPEDLVNVFKCFFDENDPYLCRNNWARGGGPSTSSGSFLLGDHGGSNGIIEDNIVVNPGQYGIGIAGGANQVIRRNKIYGSQRAWSNVGIVVANWTPEVLPDGNYTVENNRVNWTSSNGQDGSFWVMESYRYPHGWDTNIFKDPSITPNILPEQLIGIPANGPYQDIDPDPEPKGYWINKTTGEKTFFYADEPWIEGTIFRRPAWSQDASEIFIPESITEIGADVFFNHADLITLVIPSTLTHIRNNSLNGCTGLTTTIVKPIVPPAWEGNLANIGNTNSLLFVPDVSVNAYKSTPPWSNFTQVIRPIED